MASNTIDVGDWLSSEATTSSDPSSCGLFIANDPQKAIALKRRGVSAIVYAEHGFCEVTEQLDYVADNDCTVRFVFPLPPRSAVFKFTATIGDRKLITQVKRKAAAQEEFDAAVRQGHTAVHMQQQQGASLYSVEVGNLAALEECIITFSYVRILNSVAGAVEFEHQATWVPPYFTAAERDAHGNPDPSAARSNPVFTDRVSYSLSYRIQVQSSRGFSSLESPSPVAISQEGGPHVRIVTLDETVSDPSRDLTLLIELPALSADQSNAGQLLVQECRRGEKVKTMALATFVPRLSKAPEGLKGAPREIIFVVDGSGSMGGTPIHQALEASLFFVKDLPSSRNLTFNAAMFGSSYQMMWKSSLPYNQATQQDAVQWLQSNVHANWGGTEVLNVLKFIYEKMPLAKDASRQIIFLTDGGVSGSEEQGINDLVQGKAGSKASKEAAARTCIFSLGIGHGVHRGLVEGVAKGTGGLAQFVVDEEPIGRKVGLLKRCALAAEGGCLTKPRLVSRSCLVKATPNVLPPRLFPDEPLHVLVEVVKAEPGASLELSATAASASRGDGSPYSISLPLDQAVRVEGDVFAVLHAMSSIGGLLGSSSALHCSSDGTPHASQPEQRQVEDAIVALAEEEGLVTPHTSAVGVLLLQNPMDPDAVQQVEVPLQLPSGRSLWGGQCFMQQQRPMCSGGGGRGGGVRKSCPPPGAMMRLSAPSAPATLSFGAAQMAPPPPSKQSFLSAIACEAKSIFSVGEKQKKMMRKRCEASPVGPLASASPVPPASSYAMESVSSYDDRCEDEDEAERCKEDAHCDADIGMTNIAKCLASPLEQHTPLAPRAQGLSAEQVLSLLNLRRTVLGSVAVSEEVLEALAGQTFEQQQPQQQTLAELAASLRAAAARPAALASDEAWVTVLALAYLRKYLAGEQKVWAGLEAKALEWLTGVWPSDAGRSIGSVVLAAMKIV